MVQSEFNLVFWFVSYNILCYDKKVGPALHALPISSLSLPRMLCPLSRGPHARIAHSGYRAKFDGPHPVLQERVAYPTDH
jgi:hypothetical protein